MLLADLFYLFEIAPAKCVRQPGLAKERVLDVSGGQRRGGGRAGPGRTAAGADRTVAPAITR